MNQPRFAGYSEKAFEIAQALFRVGEKSYLPEFRRTLQSQGLKLASGISEANFAGSKELLIAIERLLKLGVEGGLIDAVNEQIIQDEVADLYSAIERLPDHAEEKEIADLSGIFKKTKFDNETLKSDRSRKEVRPQVAELESKSVPAGNRQKSILERIRQSGSSSFGCRLKDLQEVLPDASERTIRYDLQELLQRGEVERIGSGGPATFYRIRDNGSSSLPGGPGPARVLEA